MFARVTLLEIDTVRTDVDTALERFKEIVLPELRKQEGYLGVYVLGTAEGKGLLMSLWANEAAASVESGFYDEQLAKFMSLFRSPPGRDHYRVFLVEVPGMTPA